MACKNLFNIGKKLLTRALIFACTISTNAEPNQQAKILALRIYYSENPDPNLCKKAWNHGWNRVRSGTPFEIDQNTPYQGAQVKITMDNFQPWEKGYLPDTADLKDPNRLYWHLRNKVIFDNNPNNISENINFIANALATKFNAQVKIENHSEEDKNKDALNQLRKSIQNCGEKELIVLANYINYIADQSHYPHTSRFNTNKSQYNSNLQALSRAINLKLSDDEREKVSNLTGIISALASEKNIYSIMNIIHSEYKNLEQPTYPLALE